VSDAHPHFVRAEADDGQEDQGEGRAENKHVLYLSGV
jgi:hypothetical protein